MNTYILTYLCSLALAVVATPIVAKAARKLEIFDRPNVRKVHSSEVPRIGGVAIFLSSMLITVAVLLLDNSISSKFQGVQIQLVVLLFAATFIMLLGLFDDLCGIRVRYKLLGQIISGLLICLVGIRIESVNFANLFTVQLGVASVPLTIFWVVGITNTVNLIDGLDGLAAGISAITCGVIAVLAMACGEPAVAVMMLALMGSLSGFLFFNFNPARIFMGDSGSMFLGFMLSAGSIMCVMKSGTMVSLTLPAIALGLPIFDTAFTILRRYLERRGITSPDKGHLHHRLLDMGIHHRHAVVIMYMVSALAAGLGMFMMITHGTATIAIFACILVLLVMVFRFTGLPRLYDALQAFQSRYAATQQANKEARRFEQAQLHFKNAHSFKEWWNSICIAAERLEFSDVTLPLVNRDGKDGTLHWEVDKDRMNETTKEDIVQFMLPLPDRRSGAPLNLDIKLRKNSSLESAGHRIALFGRLLEQFSLEKLTN